jgi:hypothetical protein
MHRTAIRTLAALAIAFAPASIASAANSVFLDLSRIDDFASPAAQFLMEVNVNLDLAGVTGVTVQTGSLSLLLEEFPFGSGEWEVNETLFTDLAALRSALDGIWTVTIVGTSPSTSTFTLNAATLVDNDFFPTATNLLPADGATNVSTMPLLSWTDPTGPATPFALSVHVGNDADEQEVLSIPGVQEDILITATSWQPPVALPNGPIEFSVLYADPATSAVIGALQVTTGAITWGNDAFSPPGYPAATPLLVLASESIVQFTVPEPSAALLGAAALATAALLARRRHGLAFPEATLH